MKYSVITFILLLSFNTNATLEPVSDQGGWVNRDGKRVPNTDNMKSIRGFGGWLVVTPDVDWEAKWYTSPETTPNFTEATTVKYGETLTILPFYINPGLNSSGEASVLCNIKVIRPDGSDSINAKDIKCVSGKLHGDPGNIRLTSTVIKYVGEEGDLPGIWHVEFELTDTVRKVTLPLKTRFKLVK